jgi:hypothetical protein
MRVSDRAPTNRGSQRTRDDLEPCMTAAAPNTPNTRHYVVSVRGCERTDGGNIILFFFDANVAYYKCCRQLEMSCNYVNDFPSV